jgi:predicted lipoprotein
MSRCVSLVVALAACGGGGGSTPPKDAAEDGFDRSALLANLSRNVLMPMQTAFAQKAAALPAAITAYCNALDAGTPGTTLDAARAAFAQAIDTWQLAEAVLVGPAAMDGKTMRGWIYGWPNLSPCEVDKDVASRWANPSSYNIANEFVASRSLTAIEYLLYPTTDMHSCFNPPAGWDALGADLPRARCRLAEAIATDIAAQGVALETAWRADGGGYVDELANAGKSGSSLTSAHAALNEISDGLFYVEKMVKDMKIAEAAGIALNSCDAVQMPCEPEVELRLSDRATFAIRANLAATRQVFTGDTATTTGPGFDDFLIAVGHSDLAATMTADIDGAIAAATALPDSYLGALNTNYASVVTAHTAVKAFCDDLKSQFLTILSLEIPDDVAGDND